KQHSQCSFLYPSFAGSFTTRWSFIFYGVVVGLCFCYHTKIILPLTAKNPNQLLASSRLCGLIVLIKSFKILIKLYSFACSKFIHLLHKIKIFNNARYFIYIISKYSILTRKANKLPHIIMCKFQYSTAF